MSLLSSGRCHRLMSDYPFPHPRIAGCHQALGYHSGTGNCDCTSLGPRSSHPRAKPTHSRCLGLRFCYEASAPHCPSVFPPILCGCCRRRPCDHPPPHPCRHLPPRPLGIAVELGAASFPILMFSAHPVGCLCTSFGTGRGSQKAP